MTPQARLHELVASRDRLRASFQHAWRQLPKTDAAALDAWAGAAVELLEVNAGAACQLAFWSASAAAPGALSELASSGRAAAEICRHAGSGGALACLEALPGTLRVVDRDGLRAWWRGLERLSHEAAACVPLVAVRTQTLLADRTGENFSNLVAVGLKAHALDPAGRRAFFALEDPSARALLTRRADRPGFAVLSRRLGAFARALWGDVAILRAAPVTNPFAPRATLAGSVVLLPDAMEARLALATVAHACCHLALPEVRHVAGSLKLLQIALVTLIEDARVEALAMRGLPGLRRLWMPFHVAPPSGPRTAENLMARLSRALFDPSHDDPDGFVAKARLLFAEAAARGLEDPGLSLRIGCALGHDLGQMRVQFNWRDYVIAPEYRDDGNHLWGSAEQPAKAIGLTDQAPASRGSAADANARGVVIGRYPEWDAASGMERPDWTTLREVPAAAGGAGSLRAAMDAHPALRGRLAALVRASTIGRPVRLRRQADGDELDLDAALDATIAMRAGHPPDPRCFRLSRPRSRDLATIVLLDSSASTEATVVGRQTVLDLQRLAVALLAEALDARGDPVALQSFASDGRHDVRLSRIKTFSGRFDEAALARLAGLRSDLSTRLGTALRHARHEFDGVRAWRRLLLVLTDGEPADIDVADSNELVVDARRAVLGLRHAAIDVFGVRLDPRGIGSANAIFGPANTVTIRDLTDLPARLAGLYFRLRRR